MKYIVVTGGVVSGLGKGITISSIGRILKASGVRVTSIKIDPYLNVDAGILLLLLLLSSYVIYYYFFYHYYLLRNNVTI